VGWEDWSEAIGEPCPLCKGAGVLDTGDKGHGRCPTCEGRGELEPEGPQPDPEEDDPGR
jgi:DnaJ-class molecular chaperone